MKSTEWIALIEGEHNKKFARAACIEAAYEVRPRHEAEQGEGLRDTPCEAHETNCPCGHKGIDCPYDKCPYLAAHPTPTKPTESLAVLAYQKGMKINISHPRKEWAIGLRWRGVGTDKRGPVVVFKNPVYALAEQAARAYLEGLADKEGV